MKQKIEQSVRKEIVSQWKVSIPVKTIHSEQIVDITPLARMTVKAIQKTLSEFFISLTDAEKNILRSRITNALVNFEEEINVKVLSDIAVQVLFEVIDDFETKVKESGIKYITDFKDLNISTKSLMRWLILYHISQKPMTAMEIAKKIPKVRERAIRNALLEMVKATIAEESSEIRNGKVVKTYFLSTSVFVIDFRRVGT